MKILPCGKPRNTGGSLSVRSCETWDPQESFFEMSVGLCQLGNRSIKSNKNRNLNESWQNRCKRINSFFQIESGHLHVHFFFVSTKSSLDLNNLRLDLLLSGSTPQLPFIERKDQQLDQACEDDKRETKATSFSSHGRFIRTINTLNNQLI